MAIIESLQRCKATYQNEKDILDNAIRNTRDVKTELPTSAEIGDMKKELFSLKHMGEDLKRTFNEIECTRETNHYTYFERPLKSPTQQVGLTKWLTKLLPAQKARKPTKNVTTINK